jgi:ribosomal protein S18 acetylase RimI-like enzyme
MKGRCRVPETLVKMSDDPEPDAYSDTVIRRVNWAQESELVRRLFQGYRDWIAKHADTAGASDSTVPLGLRQLDRVIAELPGDYGPPKGDVLLAFKQSDVVACAALRGLETGVGEIKRIYVRPDHFGPVFGPRLVTAILSRAREIGYRRVRVDALPSMKAAIQYYQELGFKPIESYWAHPVSGALFFEWRAT